MIYQYPFGEQVLPVEQKDKTPKKVFVLGVYTSPVQARWKKDGCVICESIPVADEPRLFWDGNGEEAKEIVGRVNIPAALGTLEPAGDHHNGVAAKVLDEHILAPLGLTRGEVWFCDCLPEARLFPSQYKEIHEKYDPYIREFDLNDVMLPKRPVVFCDDKRARAIAEELILSEAELLVLLGDIPLGQFLKKVAAVPYRSLEEYSETYGYGNRTKTVIRGKEIEVLPLAHPRQIGVFGAYNEKWHLAHLEWEKSLEG